MRANEKFSGRGHARHLCKDCAQLGDAELKYRQAVHDLERITRYNGSLSRRNRRLLSGYLKHEDQRVRDYALRIEIDSALAAAEARLLDDLDACLQELALEGCIGPVEIIDDVAEFDRSEIPF
jgi:hypothetical protein